MSTAQRMAEQAVVQRALARGWLGQEQLRAALLLQHRLAAEGRPVGLLPLLARGLDPRHLPELTGVWQASLARSTSGRLGAFPGPQPDVPAEALRESNELVARPPEEDPEPVRRFLEESRRGPPPSSRLEPPSGAGSPAGQATATATSRRPGEPPAAPAGVPARLGGYRVVRELARGGMGIVYEAHALGLDRRVALKVLRGPADGQDLRRFLLEARAAARLRHPAIVGVHEVGEDHGVHFIAMDLVQGPSLKARIQAQGPLDPTEAARVALRVAQALEVAHEHDLLHRDVKPHNVLLDEVLGEAVLGDFGLAKELDRGEGPTATGEALGTPAYMAPEQVDGRAVDPRTDVWGLGATLYEALAGRPPFQATTPVGVAQAILREDPAPPSRWRAGLPPDLETVCLKCLEKDPARRYARARDLAEDLRRFLADEPIAARRPGLLARARRLARRHRALAAGALGGALLIGAALAVRERLGRRVGEQAAAQRRGEVEALLGRARAGELGTNEALTAAVFQLTRGADPAVAERLCAELEALVAELRGAELAALQGVIEPDAEEAARGERALTGLEAALAAREPGTWFPRDLDARATVQAALRRLEARGQRRGRGPADTVGPAPPGALELVAARQSALLGPRVQVARVCCEALARIEGARERAVPVLAAYLGVEAEAGRAVSAALALTQLGGESALRPVLAALDRFGERGPFALPVKRALASEAVHRALSAGTAGDVRALIVRGELRAVAHDAAGAREAFDQALALDPRCAEAWRRRGLARLELHDPQGALADCAHALELAAQDAQGWVARSTVRRELRDLDGALADANRAVELAPQEASAWRARARVRAERKDHQGAVADATRALELDPRDPFAWAIRGEMRHEAGDAGALADLDRALELEPGLPAAWRTRAGIRFQRGDQAAALADYNRALELDPGSVASWVNRGAVRLQLGDHAGALADYSRAIELDPRQAEAWEGRSRVRLMQEDHGGALADSGHALELEPGNPRAWCTHGIAALRLGDLPRALADLDRAVELAPEQADVRSNRAAARLAADDLAGAREDLDRAVALSPEETTFWINRGRVREATGDLKGALEDFGRAVGLAPKSAQAWRDRGRARARAGDLEGGIEDLQRAVRLDLGSADLYHDLGLLLMRAGDYEQAGKALDEALLRQPRHVEALGARGGLRVLQGDLAAARADYQRFLDLAPEHPAAAEVRAWLEGQGGAPGR